MFFDDGKNAEKVAKHLFSIWEGAGDDLYDESIGVLSTSHLGGTSTFCVVKKLTDENGNNIGEIRYRITVEATTFFGQSK